MSDTPAAPKFQRHISLLGLTFFAVSGILGSGWLFVPLISSQIAGPASVVSWVIGAFAMLLIALCFSEIVSLLPVAGGIARIPHFTHGDMASMAMGWTAWIGYSSQAPLQVLTMLRYLGPSASVAALNEGQPLWHNPLHALIVVFVLSMFVVANLWGIRFLTTMNTGMTWIKSAVIFLIIVGLFSSHNDFSHFTVFGGFAPNGWTAVLAAIPSAGIIFSLIGFRHAIDLAGEVKNPQRSIPSALVLSLLICTTLYVLLQSAFIVTVPSTSLNNGWSGLHLTTKIGPLASLALTLGLHWMTGLIYLGVFLGPFGDGLVSTASNGRLGYALSENRLLPKFLMRLSLRGVPMRMLWLNFVIGALLVLFLPFAAVLQINEAAITLSFAMGPLAVYSLRSQLPEMQRRFRLPFVRTVSIAAFTVASLIIYWTGWQTLKLLGGLLVVGFVFLMLGKWRRGTLMKQTDWRGGAWLAPYILGIGVISYFGQYDGGTKQIPFGWDMVLMFGLCLGVFVLAFQGRLPRHIVEQYIERYKTDQRPDTLPL